MRWLLGVVPLAALLTACPPHIDTGADGGGPINVGSGGGIFVREGTVIQIPAGAVPDGTIIFVTVVDDGIPDAPGRARISYGYRFTPSSLLFSSPATLSLPYLTA